MKILKIVLISIGSLIIILVAAAFLLPIFFKDNIKKAVDKQLAASVNADFDYKADDFGLSLFRHFPTISVEMKNLKVINREPFAGHPLFGIERLDVGLNLMDVLFGDQIKVKRISLVRPDIHIKVLKDGTANYDIAIAQTDTVTTTQEESSPFSLSIEHWDIIDGKFIYDDAAMTVYFSMNPINHSGKGDFTEKEFDLVTQTKMDSIYLIFDGVQYMSNKIVQIDATIGIAEEFTKYTFKKNNTTINDFAMSFDGWLKVNENDYDMDITFGSPDNSFKSILSLVPGVYTKDFKGLKTAGDLTFNGTAKGTYSETTLPAFSLNLIVKDGMFKYPDLPESVKNIQMDLVVDNPTTILENTVVDLKNLHLEFGSNPVDAKFLIKNLKDYAMKGNVSTKLNLAELTKMFPIDSLELKGIYSLRANVDGVYDAIKKVIPKIDADMTLDNGYAKSLAFPLPLEKMKINANVKNTSGRMAETVATINTFSMWLDGEEFAGAATFKNLDDYTWDIKAKGGLDLEKITKIFPVEGMKIAGKIKGDLTTKGKYSDVTAERYHLLPTSGSVQVNNFTYASSDLPYKVTIIKSETVFNPSHIEVKNTLGTIGKSDFAIDGSVSNYIGYVFGKETISGKLNFASTLLDLNEFMEESDAPAQTDTVALSAFPIPENIHFTLKADIKKTKMMDYDITDAKGNIILKDGVAYLDGLTFMLLDGKFGMTGNYHAKDINQPVYDMDLSIANLSINQAASAFSMVKNFAPIASLARGNFSMDFNLKGKLKKDMMPDLATVSGEGLIKIAQATISKTKLVSGLMSFTKNNQAESLSLKDVLMNVKIADGKLHVQPFNLNFAGYSATIGGFTSLDQSIGYTMKMKIPNSQLGSQYQSLMSSFGGGNTNEEIDLPINIGGTFTNPKLDLNKDDLKSQTKAVVKETATQTLQDVVSGQTPKEAIGNLLKPKAKTDTDSSTQKQETNKTKDIKNEADALKGAVKDLFKKKK